MNLSKTSKTAEGKSSVEISYVVRVEPKHVVLEAKRSNAAEPFAGVTVSREEKPELAAALEAGCAALSGYIARALAAEFAG